MSTNSIPERIPESREVRTVEQYVEVQNERFEGAASQAKATTYEEVATRDVPRRQSPDQNGATLLQSDPRALMRSRGFNV